MDFKQLLKKKELLQVIEESGFTKATQIQEEIIPLILDGNDVVGQSQTGTGKTLAFAAPILETIEENKQIQTLVLAPTRELAIQIAREIEKYSKYTNISVTCVYGSSSIEDQIRSLKKGCEIVIGTPGRVKDLIKRRVLKLTEIKFFVLDEADEMLSMGFQEELEFIFEKTNNDRQVLLFSATMPKPILNMAKNYMSSEYKQVSVITDVKTAAHIEQKYYLVSDKTRIEAMCRVMDYYNPKKAIIFCRTKRNADEVLEKLSNKGYSTDVIHGDITQGQRIATLDRFKAGIFNYLIATDVAARGIHVDDIELVINYNLPESHEAYVHRIGRTGRVDKKGIAVTFIKESEQRILGSLEHFTEAKIIKTDLPTLNDILPNRVNEALEEINSLKNNGAKLNLFKDYLDKLEIEEVKNIANQLLEKELTKNLGSNFNTSIDIKEKRTTRSKDRVLDDSIRVFVTIGKLDNIEKREFLKFIEKTASVKEGTCTGVEIMTKFTFMNIKKDCYDKVLEKCNNIKYNGRIIRIEKAKK
ncbi:MAG: DEAD/DEAH box helicase [Bacilli bacterium]